MSLTVNIKGLPELNRNLQRLAKAYPQATGAAMHDEALDIFADSQELVPEDTSALKLSGYVTPPTITPVGPVVEIGYGTKEGGDVDYAVVVHESPNKQWQKAGASNKYLERPAKDAVRGMEGRIATKVRRVAR